MPVVVTGAAGHIGANLLHALVAQGRPTRALVHLDRRVVEGLGVEVIAGDVCNLDSLVDAFTAAEVVYHLAAHTRGDCYDQSLSKIKVPKAERKVVT